MSAQTPHIIAAAGHDDGLFVELAENLIAGVWLGHGNDLTLAKGVFFPIFLALNTLIGVKYVTCLQSLFVLSGLLVIWVLRRMGLGKTGLFIAFVLFIFSPSTASLNARRLVRDGLYTALLVFMLAAAFGLVDAIIRRKRAVLWAIGCGLALGALWVTREEGMAVVPALAVLALGAIVLSRRIAAALIAIMVVTISGLVIPMTILSLNYAYYRVAIVTEMQSEYFTHAYGALSRVKHDQWRQYIPVPKHVREKIYKVSPAFASLERFLEESTWIGAGCRYIDPCDDLSSHFVWGFRKAVVRSRYYASLEDSRLFYQRLAAEVDDACDRGQLDCLAPRASLVPPYRSEYREQLIATFFDAWRYLLSFEGLDPYNLVWSPSDSNSLRRIGRLLNYRRLHQIEQRTVSGWVVSATNAPLEVYVMRTDGEVMSKPATFSSGPSVRATIKKTFDRDLPAAEQSRFEVRTACSNNCLLRVVNLDSQHEAVFSLDSSQAAGPQAIGEFYYSVAALSSGRDITASESWRFGMLDAIWPLYQTWLRPLLCVSLAGFTILLLRLGRDRFAATLLVFAAALLIAIGARLGLLTYIHVTSFHAINDLYCMPCYALLLLFVGIGLAVLTDCVISLAIRWRTKSS